MNAAAFAMFAVYGGAFAVLAAWPVAFAIDRQRRRRPRVAEPGANPFAEWGARPSTRSAAPVLTVASHALSVSPATPGTPAAPRDGSVAEWRDERVMERPGAKIAAGVLVEDYARWCSARGETPVSTTRWGLLMKKTFGLRGERLHNRVRYHDLELRKHAS